MKHKFKQLFKKKLPIKNFNQKIKIKYKIFYIKVQIKKFKKKVKFKLIWVKLNKENKLYR